MRPAWVQVQVHPTLAECYRLYSLSKNTAEKEENGTKKCFSSSCACLPHRWVDNHFSLQERVKREAGEKMPCPRVKSCSEAEGGGGNRQLAPGQGSEDLEKDTTQAYPPNSAGRPLPHPSVPPSQSPAPPESLSPTSTSDSAPLPWPRGPHQTAGSLHSPCSAGEEAEQGQAGDWSIDLPTSGTGQAPLYSPPKTTLTLVFMSSSDRLDTDVQRGFVTCPRLDSKQRTRKLKSTAAWSRGACATARSGPSDHWFPWTTAHRLGARAHRLGWGSHRPLGPFRKRLRARPPGKMTSRLHCVEHNDYIQISHVQNDVWLTRPWLKSSAAL